MSAKKMSAQMDNLLQDTDTLLRHHVTTSGVTSSSSWSLLRSPIGGRGVFATRDLLPGDLVFVDPPLVVGPRSGEASQPLCVGCHRSGVALVPCSRGCGLPVCGKGCEIRRQHGDECERLRGWRVRGKDGRTWSPELLRALTPVRCLSLDNEQRRLVRRLEAHKGSLHEREMQQLKNNIDVAPSAEDEEFIRYCCCVLDANAFEVSAQILTPVADAYPPPPTPYPTPDACPLILTPVADAYPPPPTPYPSPDACPLILTPVADAYPPPPTPYPTPDACPLILTPVADVDSQKLTPSADATPEGTEVTHTSLRGLYPLAAMMNHECTPNTRHGYDKNLCMVVQASVAIPRGAEITTSYFALMWGTSARRHHLHQTKHFYCFCSRCRDPQEGGTRLSALKCATSSCPGSLLAEEPVRVGGSKWRCDLCGVRLPEKQTRLIQSGLGTMLRVVRCDDPVQIQAFLRNHDRLFATSNQVVVELKSSLVWIYGHFPGYHWPDLSDAVLETKANLCRELLRLLEQLKAGQCRLRGLFLYELHCTLAERHSRRPTEITQEESDEASAAIEEAAAMFRHDVTAPPDLWVRLRIAHNNNTENAIVVT